MLAPLCSPCSAPLWPLPPALLYYLSLGAKTLSEEIAKGAAIGDLLLVITDSVEREAREFVLEIDPTQDSTALTACVIVEPREKIVPLLHFAAPEASAALNKPSAPGAIRIATIADGGVGVSYGFFSSKKKRLRRQGEVQLFANPRSRS